MLNRTGSLWDALPEHINAKVIPTNGITKIRDGFPLAVMGAGLAKAAIEKWPELQYRLGERLMTDGNRVYVFELCGQLVSLFGCWYLVTLPTKNHFKDDSDLTLIADGLRDLEKIRKAMGWEQIWTPLLGTGMGRLPKKNARDFMKMMLNDHYVLVEQDEST